jgi:hypothetical protein
VRSEEKPDPKCKGTKRNRCEEDIGFHSGISGPVLQTYRRVDG